MTKNCVSVWNNCLLTIKEEIHEQSFRTWFLPIVPLALEGNTLTIQVPTQFFYEWLEEHYVGLLKKAVFNELGGEGRLNYSIIVDKGDKKNSPLTVNIPGKESKKKIIVGAPTEDEKSSLKEHQSNLNPKYIFDNYIEGDYNRLPRSAGLAVAQSPGTTSFNPLTIYGGVGLGKTHLAQAIGNSILKNYPEKKVLYIRSDKFVSDFYDAIRFNNIQDFNGYYATLDVLIIDDIQFFGGKEKMQEIFFNIFNHLHQTGKQIIMTSDCAPKDLKGLEERLLSRFKWGLTADLTQPDVETKMAIIINKLREDGMDIDYAVVEFIAHNVDTNIRDLEGIINSIIANSVFLRKEIDLELVKKCIQSQVHEVDGEVSIEYIQKFVANFYDIDIALLKSKTRKQEIVQPRQVAMYFAKIYTKHTFANIGEYFGGKDHSTVIHSVNTVQNLIQTDKKFKAKVNEMKKKLKLKTV